MVSVGELVGDIGMELDVDVVLIYVQLLLRSVRVARLRKMMRRLRTIP